MSVLLSVYIRTGAKKMPKINEGYIRERIEKSAKGKEKIIYTARYQYIDDAGRRRDKTKIVANKTEGNNWLKQQAREHETKNSNFGKKEIRFLEFTEEIEDILRNRRSVATMLIQLNFLREYFGKIKLTDITFQHLEGYRDWRRKNKIQFKYKEARTVKDATIAKEFGLLSKIFTIAKERKYLSVSPFAFGGTLVSGKSETHEALMTAEQEKRLLEACLTKDKYGHTREHLYPIIIFAIDTASRRGEIRLLEWRDVDLERQVINLRKETTKSHRARRIPMTARLMEVLENHKPKNAKPTERVFTQSAFKKSYAKVLEMAGLENFTFHDLRHVGTTRFIEKNFNPALAMKIVGHEQMSTFSRYLNPTPESLVEIMRKSESVN